MHIYCFYFAANVPLRYSSNSVIHSLSNCIMFCPNKRIHYELNKNGAMLKKKLGVILGQKGTLSVNMTCSQGVAASHCCDFAYKCAKVYQDICLID